MTRSMLFLSMLVACGSDPILERADEEASSEPAANTSNTSSDPGAAGVPEEPQPGMPAEPPPGAPPMPDGPAGGPTFEGPTVTLEGEVAYPDYKEGKVRIDVFDGDQRDHSIKPSVVTTKELSQPGAFTLEVPEEVKRVWISAFVDENNNQRPDHGDPTGFYDRNPVSTKKSADGLVITLSADAPQE